MIDEAAVEDGVASLSLSVGGATLPAPSSNLAGGGEAEQPPSATAAVNDPFDGLRPTIFRPRVDETVPRPAVDRLRELLDRTFRVELKDG